MDDWLLHYGTKGMKWGQRRAVKKAEKAQRKSDKIVAKVTKKIDKYEKKGKTKSEQSLKDAKQSHKSAKENNRDDSWGDVASKGAASLGYAHLADKSKAKGNDIDSAMYAKMSEDSQKSNRTIAKEHATDAHNSASNAQYYSSKYGKKIEKRLKKAEKKGADTSKLRQRQKNYNAYANEVNRRAEERKKKVKKTYGQIAAEENGMK